MSARKLTEVAIGSTPTEDTHFLVTQPETVNNETMEAVRRPTSGSIKDLIAGGLIAPKFSDQSTYAAGSYVLKNGVLYKFTAAHSGAWTGTDAEEVTVGSELNRLENSGGGSGSGLTEDIKTALLACFEKVAWIDEDGQDYYDALYSALYPPADLVSISAVFTQGSAVIYDTDSLDTLRQYLVVTAHMSDSSTQTVTDYVLSGTLSVGTSTITVTYGGKTATFNVTVSSSLYPLQNGTIEFNNNRTITVTENKHFLYTNTSAAGSGTGAYVKLGHVLDNDPTTGAGSDNHMYDSTVWFTIRAGSTYQAKLSNIELTCLNTQNYNISFRDTQGTALINFGDRNNTNDATVTGTAETDMEISEVGLYARNSYSSLSGDISLTVDGQKWI